MDLRYFKGLSALSIGTLKDRNSKRLGMTYGLGLKCHCKDWQLSHNAIGQILQGSMSFSDKATWPAANEYGQTFVPACPPRHLE